MMQYSCPNHHGGRDNEYDSMAKYDFAFSDALVLFEIFVLRTYYILHTLQSSIISG